MRIQCPETPRVPPEGSSTEGKSGPKARPKGVVDGQRVNIPVLMVVSVEGRRRLTSAGCWLPVQAGEVMKSGENASSRAASTRVYGLEVVKVKLPRKALRTLNHKLPVPETDTGGEVE